MTDNDSFWHDQRAEIDSAQKPGGVGVGDFASVWPALDGRAPFSGHVLKVSVGEVSGDPYIIVKTANGSEHVVLKDVDVAVIAKKP